MVASQLEEDRSLLQLTFQLEVGLCIFMHIGLCLAFTMSDNPAVSSALILMLTVAYAVQHAFLAFHSSCSSMRAGHGQTPNMAEPSHASR